MNDLTPSPRGSLVVAVPLAVAVVVALAACTSGSDTAEAPITSGSTTSKLVSPTPGGATTMPLEYSTEPIAIEPGSRLIEKSEWSVADFTVNFPKGWTVQYGHVYAKHPDKDDEFGFYPVVVDDMYADACKGSTGQLMHVGPSVDDLATAMLQQAGPRASEPIDTTLGGYPATRIDLTVPEDFNLKACNLGSIGLQVWYSVPSDKYFVLLEDGIASVYIVDVDGQRQVFLAQHQTATSTRDLEELQTTLDSIRIET